MSLCGRGRPRRCAGLELASIKFDNPLYWIGSYLSSSQLIVGTQQNPGGGVMNLLRSAQLVSLDGRVNSLAASLHAGSALPLETPSATLYQVGTRA